MRKTAVAWFVVLVLAGCGGSVDRRKMLRVDPGERWRSSIEAVRTNKDEFFKRSPASPLRSEDRGEFQGLEYWEPDPELYFVGPINEFDEKPQLQMATTSGEPRPTERFGWIAFEYAGHQLTLNVYRLLDSPDPESGLLLAFNDETSGETTYPAGRYIDLDGAAGGPYVMDFNRAYNPSCAYGDPERFACPIAPPENRLPLPVEAGERGFFEP